MAMGSKLQSKTATPAPVSVISLNPDTFTTGGGLLDDADVVVKDAAFLMWDYNGQQAVPVPALGITFRILGEEDDPDPAKDHDQYYSCGKPEDFAPSQDRSGLVPIGTKTGLNNNTNAGLVIAGFMNVGVPKTAFDTGNIKTALIGTKVHVNRVPAPERKGGNIDPNKKYEVLIPTKLLSLPGEGVGSGPSKPGLSKISQPRPNGAPAPGRPATQPTTPPTPAAASAPVSDELDAAITEKLLEIIEANGGTIAKKLIGPKLFAAFKGNPDQGAAMRRGSSDDFLMGLAEAGFTYDGATLTLAG